MSICLSITKKNKQLHLHIKQIVLIKIITHKKTIITVRMGETIQIDAKKYKKQA